ncbi:MAG: hypothetical protein IT378_13340, partial [Sandaracinaceae bacterium]|nr:hypothetical protein [Sandaracinaceae bacterium]
MALAAFAAIACGGEGPVVPETDGGPPPTDAFVPFTPVDVETVAPASVRAGDPFMVNCLLVDSNGETQAPPAGISSSLRVEPEGSIERTGDTFVATRAGQVEVACSFPSLALADTSPSIVEVVPGAAAYVEARLDRDTLVAGESVAASCFAVDQYGNTVTELEPALRADPAADGNTFDGTNGTFQRAGLYEVYCDVAGTESRGARLEVVPGLPASLVISLVPDQPVYAVGQVIALARIVEDRFGNRIDDAQVPVTSTPRGGTAVGDGRFRYGADGRYTLTATVTPPTLDDVPLSASVEILVDSGGPQIRCDSPANGAILDQAPGSSVTFRGSVSDLSGVSNVRVNGVSVAVDGSGNFSRTLTGGFGINFVDVAATDGTGRESSRTCAFLLADQWAPTTGTYNDTVSLRLTQTAIDDNNRSGSLNSLSDILNTALSSAGLRNTLHNQLLASNPIKPSSCDQNLCVPIVGCACVLRSEVIYLNSQLNGPNTAALTLVSGGLRAQVSLNNTRVQLRVRGSVSGIPYDTTGWVTFSNITVNATFDIGLSGGRPRITVRAGSVSTSVGSISTSFSGLDGAIIDIVASIANGTLRNMVRDLVTNWVRDNFNSILDGVVGNLDIATLGTSFNVPRLDGSGNITLSFTPSFSSLSTTSTRALFGVGTRLTAPAAHARPTLGTPIPSGTVLL